MVEIHTQLIHPTGLHTQKMKLLPQQSCLLILNEQSRIVVVTILFVRETISVLEVTVQNATVTNQIVTVTIQMVTTTILVCSFYFNKQLC